VDVAVYYRAIRAYWPIALGLAILGGTGFALIARHQHPVYRAETQLLVSFIPSGQVATGSEASGPATGQLMQRRVKTYASMLNDQRVTEPVIRSLRLPYTPDELSGHIFVTSPVNTFAIDIAVTDSSASRSARIADGLAAELAEAAQRDKPTKDLPAQTRIQVVRGAAQPQRPLPARWQLKMLLGALAGVVLGLGLAVALQYGREGRPVTADLRDVWSAATSRPRARRPHDA
jgi:capsular polysaccharide biosynthesis protein